MCDFIYIIYVYLFTARRNIHFTYIFWVQMYTNLMTSCMMAFGKKSSNEKNFFCSFLDIFCGFNFIWCFQYLSCQKILSYFPFGVFYKRHPSCLGWMTLHPKLIIFERILIQSKNPFIEERHLWIVPFPLIPSINCTWEELNFWKLIFLLL